MGRVLRPPCGGQIHDQAVIEDEKQTFSLRVFYDDDVPLVELTESDGVTESGLEGTKCDAKCDKKVVAFLGRIKYNLDRQKSMSTVLGACSATVEFRMIRR